MTTFLKNPLSGLVDEVEPFQVDCDLIKWPELQLKELDIFILRSEIKLTNTIFFKSIFESK